MNFHGQLSAEIARQLTPKLRPRYLALLTERFVVETLGDLAVTTANLSPDVGVVESTRPGPGASQSATAVAPLRLEMAMPESILHFSIEVRDRAERRLVTCIEVLSPTNKLGRGRDEYLAKRDRLLLSTAHLLEIDLLREGQRVPMRQPLPSTPYFVILSRYETRPLGDVWPIVLDMALPTVRVPLLPGDDDVMLDLQQAVTNVYDQCGYDIAVDYTKPPEIPLDPESAAWADARLRAAKLRP